MKNLSFVKEAGSVIFPEFQGERVYMLPFTKKKGLPSHLNRWSKTVSMLLDGVDVAIDQDIYLMIDQKEVKAGQMHRRGGVHIDGYWIPGLEAHTGSPYGSHLNKPPPSSGGHRIPEGHRMPGGHATSAPLKKKMGSHSNHLVSASGQPYEKYDSQAMEFYAEWPAEALVLASNVEACRAWKGLYEGDAANGGDCDHIDRSKMEEIILKPYTSYQGNVTMLHESLPMPFDCQRTLVRLNIPGWSPSTH